MRATIAIILMSAGLSVMVWAGNRYKDLPKVVALRTVTETKVVIKEPPPPPGPQVYSTGQVYIKVLWRRSEKDQHADGEYQIETSDGVISVIVLCSPEPSFDRGDLVEIFYTDKRTSIDICYPFIKAHMIKRGDRK